MKKLITYLVFFLNFIFFCSLLSAETFDEILIKGNKRILKETIIEYGRVKTKYNYSIDELNKIQKNIFETDFFEKVSLKIDNNRLIIDVVENPLINFYNINIKGIDSADSSELNKLYDNVKLGPNKIFSEYKFKDDINFIKEYYFRKGFTEVEVRPRISKLENNKVNISIVINKNELTNVNRIYFIGNKKFDSSELKSVMTLSEYSWWKILSKTSVDEYRVAQDKTLIKKFYLNNGYFDIQIPSVEIKKLNNNTVDIFYTISEGRLYQFGNFSLSEESKELDNETLEYIDLAKNKFLKNYYSALNKERFIKNLINYFSVKKIEFLNPTILENKNNNKINLTLKIQKNQKTYINKIDVKGNTLTEESVIRQNLTFSEGDSYMSYKVENSIDKLKSLGIFADVKIIPQQIENGTVNIKVEISEKPTGSISASAGYGTNGGLFVFSIGENNFLGKGIKLNTNLTLGTQKIEGRLNLVVPDFANSDNTLFSSIYVTRSEYTNTLYTSNKKGFDLGTRYELIDNIYFRPGYGLDFEKIDVASNASAYFRTQDGDSFTQRINYNIETDQRDRKYKTKNGYIYGFTQELASFGSDVPYLKNSIYGSNYFLIFDKANTNLKYGFSNITNLNSGDVLKLSDRLFIPSAYSKGFAPRAFGPKDSSSGNYIGGSRVLYSMFTQTIPTPVEEKWNLNTTAFITAFDVWGVDTSLVKDTNSIRSAYGLAFDWTSPIGPISISLSKILKKEDTDSSRTFNFELGTVF